MKKNQNKNSLVILILAMMGILSTIYAQDTAPKNEVKAVPGDLIIKPVNKKPKAPLFFHASADHTIDVAGDIIRQRAVIKIQKLQGDHNMVSIALSVKPENLEVTGAGNSLKEWALRKVGEQYYLDLTASDPKFKTLDVTVKNSFKWKAGVMKVMTFGADKEMGNVGFLEKVTLNEYASVRLNVVTAEGFSQMKSSSEKHKVLLSNKLTKLSITADKNFHDDTDLRNISLVATLAADGKSALVRLSGDLNVRKLTTEKFLLLKGRIALTETLQVKGVKLHVINVGQDILYELKPEQIGVFPINVQFALKVNEVAGWKSLSFTMPNGAVVPIQLNGVNQAVEFKKDEPSATILHQNTGSANVFQGVVPAAGACVIQWKKKRKVGDGELFFTSEGRSDIRIGAGLMETVDHLKFKILQGKIKNLIFDLEGSGEVLSVVGSNIASWKVDDVNGKKILTCVFTSARSEIGDIRIAAQSPLGKFPAKINPLTITPQGAMRHSGYVKITNKGAVRIEASKTDGLMQLAPNQYPATEAERKEMAAARQLFIYRYPSADRSLEIAADQIIPEVAVSHISVYELGETDRIIYADIEIDIREAGLREWSFKIPENYALSAVQCAQMADHVVSTTAENGMRMMKVIFTKEVMGRQLIKVRLEKNQAASIGDWQLPKLNFTGAISVRGEIGVQAEHGWRVTAKSVKGLTDRALAYFPKRSEKLQQAYRTRDDAWTAEFTISAMGQSVQADLFHLYNLKESTLEAKILVNYFVIGAPASKWELLLPTSAENVSVEGQNVRSWEINNGILLVHLQQPALGSATLLITYEETMQPNDAGSEIQLGGVAPMNVQSEAGFIHLVSNSQVQSKQLEQTKGLHSISPLEMPSSFQVLSAQPSVAAWQYSTRPYTLKLNVQTPELVESIDQVIGAATLNTKITSAGEVVTNATFLVNTRGKKALRITLPEGNKLWSAKSDRILINARVDGDQYILPLPPTDDPNRYRTVEIRYGGVSSNPSSIKVGPPVLSAPMTIAEWKVSGDNHLVVTGGNVKPLQSAVQKDGFDWVRADLRVLVAIIVFLLGGVLLSYRKAGSKWLRLFGLAWLSGAMLFSIVYAFKSMDFHVESLKEFNVIAPVVGNQETVLLELRNDANGVSTLSTAGMILMLIGFGVLIASQLKKLPSILKFLGLLLLCVGALYHIGGAFYFYIILALVAFVLLVRSFMATDWGQWKTKKKVVKPKTSVTASVVIGLIALLGAGDKLMAEFTIAESIHEKWDIKEETVTATMQVEWNAKQQDSITILAEPATLTANTGTGYRIVKIKNPDTGKWNWKIVAEVEGQISATITYTMAMKNIADRPWNIPSGKAVVKSLNVQLDQQNWSITSPQAIQTELSNPANVSSSQMTLIGITPASLVVRPKPRDRENEKLRFFVEMADIYLPAAGVLDGRHLLNVRPLSGQIESLVMDIPSDLLVGDVISPQVDSWRFDAAKKTLTLNMQSPQIKEFSLMIVTQKGIKAFPQDLLLEPIKVQGAENIVGMFGYGFGAESQPDNDKVEGLLEVNIADFNKTLLKMAKTIQPSFVLHKAYRYGNEGGNIKLRVAAVAPEVRVDSLQEIRLTDERLSVRVETVVDITRAGIFELKFKVPKGLTVETINGPALRDWSESEVKKERVVTMFLNGKTIGQQRFIITMLGETADIIVNKENWMVPKWSFEGVARQRGTMMIVPDHGIRLRVIERKNVSQVNNRNQDANSKNTLQFRMLQSDWVLGLSVQKLDAWVTAELLQEVTLKENITKKRVSIHYNVENSVVKSFRIKLPNVSAEQAQTVRASGPEVKEIVLIENDIWEIRMKQAVIGKVSMVVAYEDSNLRKNDMESIQPIDLIGVEQATHYVVVRAPGRLDIKPDRGGKKLGWRVFDWAGVPKYLHNVSDRSVPGLCYRVTKSSEALAVSVKRHAMAGTLKLRVEQGEMRTLLSSDGSSLSRLSLQIRVIEESSLRVTLPENAELFNVVVNDESVAVVRDGDEYRFIVAEASEDNVASQVKITYRIQGRSKYSDVKLLGPSLNIPLEKIHWYVMLPDGYHFNIKEHAGFDYQELINLGNQDYVKNFVSHAHARKRLLREKGQRELQQAMTWSSEGKLDKANYAFNRVFQNSAVDAASNEDARVKLERNMTSQAIMGLNTRRQQMYLDNKKAGNAMQSNGALEKAASENPFFTGKQNFDPNQLSNYMLGNTQEEINAMSRIAKKLVGNQLDIPQAMQAINVELLETSQVLHFYRDIQLSGDSHPAIELGIKQQTSESGKGSNGTIIIILILAALVGGVMYRKF